MATYDKETKFFWLQLKEDFFDDDAIEWLEEQENGEKYVLFYIKLCLKALKTNGVLIRRVGNILIPYDIKKLQEITKTKNIDTVRVAIELLKQIGLIQILDNNAIYMTQLQNLIGSKSKGAMKKQIQREQKKLKELSEREEDKCPPLCPPNIEIELNTDIDINIEEEEEIEEKNSTSAAPTSPKENLFNFLESNFGRTISPIEWQQLEDWQNDFNDEIIKYAITLSFNANAKNINYVNAILNNWKSKGFTKIEECKNENANRKQNNSYNNSNSKPVREEPIPDWFNKKNEKVEPTEAEKREMEQFLKDFQNP